MNTNLSSPFQIGEYFRSVAKERWLFPYEIYEILTSNVNELGFVIPTVKPDSIPYGR